MTSAFNQTTLLDCQIHLVTQSQLSEFILSAIKDPKVFERIFIANVNMHALYHSLKDFQFKKAINFANLVIVDGTPIVHLLKFSRVNARFEHRQTGLDYVPPVLADVGKTGRRVCVVGGLQEDTEKIRNYLKIFFMPEDIAVFHGYFAETEEPELIRAINNFEPHLLLLAMGMPRQELFALRNSQKLKFGVMLCLGAFFDYHIGKQEIPPRWLGRFGLEWLYRLVKDPKRLWFRYILEPIILFIPLAKDILVRRRKV